MDYIVFSTVQNRLKQEYLFYKCKTDNVRTLSMYLNNKTGHQVAQNIEQNKIIVAIMAPTVT